jgi:hypothetical protein
MSLTPGVLTVRTTEFGNSLDIFFAPTRGVTGSAVLPMHRIGKLVFPPICEPATIETSVQPRRDLLYVTVVTFELLRRTDLPASKSIVNPRLRLM